MKYLTYKFLVAREDIPGIPGLKRGDPVLKSKVEIIEGYEYDVWQRLDYDGFARTRIDHRDQFAEFEIDGHSRRELQRKIDEIAAGMRKDEDEDDE